jgi:hypothetical protein
MSCFPRIPNLLKRFRLIQMLAIFAFTDLSFVIAPIFIIWWLHMPISRRLGLCVLMAGSIFCLVACVMRILTATNQSLYTSADGMLWAGLEQCLVIILGSAPPLAALRQLDFVNRITASLPSIEMSSLFTSLKSYGRRTSDETGGRRGSDRNSSDAINSAPGPYDCTPSDRGIKTATTIYQTTSNGVHKMSDLSFVYILVRLSKLITLFSTMHNSHPFRAASVRSSAVLWWSIFL